MRKSKGAPGAHTPTSGGRPPPAASRGEHRSPALAGSKRGTHTRTLSAPHSKAFGAGGGAGIARKSAAGGAAGAAGGGLQVNSGERELPAGKAARKSSFSARAGGGQTETRKHNLAAGTAEAAAGRAAGAGPGSSSDTD